MDPVVYSVDSVVYWWTRYVTLCIWWDIFLHCIRVGLKFANEMVIPMWAPLNFKQKMLLKLSNFSSDLFLKSQLTTFFFSCRSILTLGLKRVTRKKYGSNKSFKE